LGKAFLSDLLLKTILLCINVDNQGVWTGTDTENKFNASNWEVGEMVGTRLGEMAISKMASRQNYV
jgi:hypothetical protein